MNYNKMTSEDFPDWFVELLLLRATDGLDEQQQRMFDEFVEEHSNREKIEIEAERYELAVAAIDLNYQSSEAGDDKTLPDELRRKVLEGAKKHFEDATAAPDAQTGNMVQTKATSAAREQGLTSREALGWLAAAGAVVLLLTGWNPFAGPSPSVGGTEVVASKTLQEQFDDFISGDLADLIRVAWKPTDEKSITTGEVVWRDSAQEGFMVFNGLRPNNPLRFQYQLWIFDSQTGSKYPVDGGVFDITAGVKSFIPIDAKILVSGPTMFAITEEKPGGVVVSDRTKLPLLATVE